MRLNRFVVRKLVLGAVVIAWGVCVCRLAAQRNRQPAAIAVDYPADKSVFPPEITPPTFLWRDPVKTNTGWRIDVEFGDGTPGLHLNSKGEGIKIGEIDPRCVAQTNEPPKLTPQQAEERTWVPEAEAWEAIKKHSTRRPATVTITGFSDQNAGRAASLGRVTVETSSDPVGAPVFYRDVPLMPSELEKGVIKPLAPEAVPLIAWRLRYISEPTSHVLMQGLHTCANCHSFSRDGKTLGMDMDGPQNDKGLYALVPISREMSIGNENVIQWSSFRGKLGGKIRVGFMSQVSPDGQFVVTMVNGSDVGRPSVPGVSSARSQPDKQQLRQDLEGNYYVANFKDYRFLQVFYPTRGVLAWYSRETGRLQPLPGADDPRYVHTNAVWSPDGKYIVFARAEAREPYPQGVRTAESANDPNETQIQYDLYRIPFNDGKGGEAEPIAGASRNGMSNSFPKVSPDGRWIVFVQCRNGLLMRPDSQLYIVPAEGGKARRLQSNTPLMNSWHSFSPNGRWLVFSSKSRSPYTQMFLTHLDKDGRDSPAILIENATAANRAVNIPEFVNIPPGGLRKIDTPVADFYRLADSAFGMAKEGRYEAAIAEWQKALELSPDDDKAHSNVGLLLASLGRFSEAVPHFEEVLRVNPAYPDAHSNLGVALAGVGRLNEATAEFEKALEVNPASAEAHNNLGRALAREGKLDEAIAHYQRAAEITPESASIQNNFGVALARQGRLDEAITHFEKALSLGPESAEAHNGLAFALVQQGRVDEGITHFERALAIQPQYAEAHFNLGDALYYLKGRAEEALDQWRMVLRIDPSHVAALNEMAWVLATSPEAMVRDGAQAVQLAEQAARLSGGRDPAILDTLAAAYAEAGRFQEAVDITNRVLAFARQQKNQRLSEALQARLALYQAHTPFRETRQPPSPAR
jgi:tetratricopeptide (TPR) repeat protein